MAAAEQPNYTARTCAPRARCRKWRTCPACAAIRQARIADAAQRLASLAGTIAWTTIKPLELGDEAALAARNEWLRKAAPAGAIWTVETYNIRAGVHINMLHPPTRPIPMRHAETHVIPAVKEPRAVAAYISKPQSYPDPDQFAGRIYGTAGPLWQWIAKGGDLPPGFDPPNPPPEITQPAGSTKYWNRPEPATAAEQQREASRIAAQRHLPAMKAMLARGRDPYRTTPAGVLVQREPGDDDDE